MITLTSHSTWARKSTAGTTTRIPNAKLPKQIHLGYLPDVSSISLHHRENLENRLKEQWITHIGHSEVVIDWDDALKKWKGRDEVTKAIVDRRNAKRQIRLWMSCNDELITSKFGGPLKEVSECTSETFIEVYARIRSKLSERLRQEDPAEIANWWDLSEAPRLLHCYFRHTKRKSKSGMFNRKGFLEYIGHNVACGFAAIQFVRNKPLPEREKMAVSYAESYYQRYTT